MKVQFEMLDELRRTILAKLVWENFKTNKVEFMY